MDPKQVRMAANMMKNMNNSDIDNLKNMAQNKSFVPPVNPIPNQPEANATANNSSSSFPKIEKFKNQGNEFFKQGSFQEASNNYLEAILEVDEARCEATSEIRKSELQRLEITCRLNYANAKSKLGEFETVISEASQVIKLDENNGKAYFRLGQAYFKLDKLTKAAESLREALNYLKGDQTGFHKTK